MTAAISATTKRARSPELVNALIARPLLIALFLVALITLVRSAGTVDSDVAWQLWIAGRIHAGARLYTDIIENNPPLWFWMALPVDRLAAILHVRIEAVLIVAIGAATGLSLTAVNRLLNQMAPPRRSLFLAYGAAALAAVPWVHVGQREQIALIVTLPYCVLIAQRREGKSVATALAVAIGMGSAFGFALKQYFLIVPLLLEVWLLAGQRNRWRPLRPETLALAITGLCYGAALVLFEPAYLTRIVPLIKLAYGSYGAPRFSDLFGPFTLAGLATLGFVLWQLWSLRSAKANVAASLAIATFAYAAIYFIQSKGWTYHNIPLVGCGSLAVAALLAETDPPSRSLRIAAPAMLLLPLILSTAEAARPALPNADLQSAISGLAPGDTVGFLATETAFPWSVTLQKGFRYPSRYMGFWMMGAIVRNENQERRDPRLDALARQIVQETVTDFSCLPPKRIIVSRPRPGEQAFDIFPYFLRDRQFAELMSHYRVRSRTTLVTYDLRTPLGPPQSSCRKGV